MGTPETLQALEQYAFVLLPALLVAEQFGIPLPAVPALLGFGALAAHGRGNIPLMLSTMAAVALTVDFAWYELGRRRGAQVLKRLGRLSLEPDCVRRAEGIFARYGAPWMLVAKFVPGLTMVLPPLAGVFAVGRVRFAAYELAGVLLWAGTWIGVGYAFSDAVAVIAARVERLGLWLVVVAAAQPAAQRHQTRRVVGTDRADAHEAPLRSVTLCSMSMLLQLARSRRSAVRPWTPHRGPGRRPPPP